MRHLSRPGQIITLTVACASVAAVLGVLGVWITVPSWVVWPPALGSLAASVAGCLSAATTGTGPVSSFWKRLALAVGLLTAAGVSQAVRILRDGTDPATLAMRPLTAGLYLAAIGVGVLALLRLPGSRRSGRAAIAFWLDVAVVAVAAGLVMMWFLRVVPVPVVTGGLATATRVIVLATAVAAVVAVVRVGMGGDGAVAPAALWALSPVGLLGPAVLVLAPAVQQWPHLHVSVVILPVFAVLLTFATRAQVHANLALAPPSTGSRWRGTNAVSVPYTSVAVTAVMMVAVILHDGYLSAGPAGGAVLLILLVLVRQHTALRDNDELVGRLAGQIRHDDLTGLPNRRFFTEALQRHGTAATVVVCDLDGFGALNDTLGDETGDAVLRVAAERIAHAAGDDTVVARLVGDAFGLLAHGTRTDIAEALIGAFRKPLTVDGRDLLISVSAGSATDPGGAVNDLLRRAELALQQAQSLGGGRHRRHTADLDATAQHDAHLAAALRHGLDRGEFRLLFQPIVELPLGTVRAVEALIRWHPADGPMVSPAEFIPVAERTGLIIDLGLWIIETACAQAARWQDRHGTAAPRVSVNVSARQLLDPDLPGQVAAALHRHGLAPHRLTLEITETAVFAGGAALVTVHALRDLGVGIALDDFGTGHSSLTLLRTCPVTTLKVDKSFIDDLNGSPQQEAIAASLRGIADTLSLNAVAEGVETQAQADRLHALGYRYAQGFHFARPMPADEIDRYLSVVTPA